MIVGIARNYDRTIKTQRMIEESGSTKESYEDFLTLVACHIQPLEEGYTEDIDGNFAKDWLMFCDVLDILEGDRIIDGSDEYKVVGVESFNRQGQPHMEIRIRKSNP